MKPGEIFLTNSVLEPMFPGDPSYRDIGWKSKRCGRVAYDIHGAPVSGMVPVFIGRHEVEYRMGTTECEESKNSFRKLLSVE